ATTPHTEIMMAGSQAGTHTTTFGKIAALVNKNDHQKPLLVAGDIYRPAAINQLQTIGQQLDLPVFTLGDQVSPVEIATQAIEHAKMNGHDLVFIDTAGRLQIDERLMTELKDIKAAVNPD